MSDLTKILELTGPKALGLFIACTLLYLANRYGLVPLSDISTSAPAINDVVGVLAGALALMWIVEALVNFARRKFAERRNRRLIRGFLSTLAPDEVEILGLMAANDQQSFSRPLTDPVANRLVQKGLVLPATGTGNRLAWSYTVPPEVWKEMKRHWRANRAF